MSGIRGKDTKPEMQVRRYLHAEGLRYRLHAKDLPGSPDLVLPKHNAVVLVHGCFWHQHPGCDLAVMPSSNTQFWRKKLEGNRRRDVQNQQKLEDAGYRVFVVWECQINPERLNHLASAIREGDVE